MDVVLAYDSIDVYQNPKTKDEEIHAVYNGYSKFISREFPPRRRPWPTGRCWPLTAASAGGRQEEAPVVFGEFQELLLCCLLPVHGYVKGKARMKHTDEGKVYVVKTIKVSSEQEAREIRTKKEELREKRRKRRRGGGER